MTTNELVARHALECAYHAFVKLAARGEDNSDEWEKLAELCYSAMMKVIAGGGCKIYPSLEFSKAAQTREFDGELYMKVEDCRRAIADPFFMADCISLMKIALDKKASPIEAFMVAVGAAIYHLAYGPGGPNSGN